MSRRSSGGLALLEVLAGLAVWSIAVVACGTALVQAAKTQRAAERRWREILDCRGVVEAACAGIETADSSGRDPSRARFAVRVDTVRAGMIRVTAVRREDRFPPAGLTRLAWRGKGT